MRNKKILKQADKRTQKKAKCLISELEENNKLEVADNCPATNAYVNLSPTV